MYKTYQNIGLKNVIKGAKSSNLKVGSAKNQVVSKLYSSSMY